LYKFTTSAKNILFLDEHRLLRGQMIFSSKGKTHKATAQLKQKNKQSAKHELIQKPEVMSYAKLFSLKCPQDSYKQ